MSAPSSTRTELARRLELSRVEEVGEFVTGRAKGMTVTLQGEAPFTACVIDLGAAVPIARMVMRPGDLNHPDAVETGDADFDERMQVTALERYAPTLQRLLEDPRLRRALLEFLQRYPDAAFAGARLHVPSASGVTPQVIADALEIAQGVAERFAAVGFLETEEPAQLPREQALEPVEPVRPLPLKRLGLGLGGGALSYLGFAALFGVQADAFGAWTGFVFLCGGLLGGYLTTLRDS